MSDAGDGGPLHTVYGGAHLFRADLAHKLGARALSALDVHATDAEHFARAFDLADAEQAAIVLTRVRAKLEREPVEDLRIDFEDGFGTRPDAEEDAEAVRCAEQVALGQHRGTLPRGLGIRVKALDGRSGRGVRTFELFFARLAAVGRVPAGFVITLPKVRTPAEVTAAVRLCEAVERASNGGPLGIEVMLEHPAALFDGRGGLALPALIDAAEGRCRSVHFGAYDYTAALGVVGSHQRLDHAACDLARQIAQIALVDRGVQLVDGAAHVIPVGPHRGDGLTDAQRAQNDDAVHGAWRTLYGHVRRALIAGIHQGWDIHPAQIPARLAAMFVFYLEQHERMCDRLRGFLQAQQRASRVGLAFDDAASAQGVFLHFTRGLACGALTEADLTAHGLSSDQVASRS